MTTETIINVSENPHIVLGKGAFAVSQGVCVGSLSNGEPESVYGVLSFHPLNVQQDINALDDVVDMANVHDPENPLLSLLFASVESAERLKRDIDAVIHHMKESSNV